MATGAVQLACDQANVELYVSPSLGTNVIFVGDMDVDYTQLQAENQLAAALLASASGQSGIGMNMMARNSTSWNGAVYLTNLAVSAGTQPMTTTFDICGSTNGVPWDIWMSTNVANSLSSWTWLGIGYTSNHYCFSNQPLARAFYALAKPQRTMVVGWGNDEAGQCDVPAGLTNAMTVAGGGGQSLALLNNGTVVAWGQNDYGQGSVPANLAGVSMIGSGWYHNVALLTNGHVTAWGLDGAMLGWHLTEVPPDLTNAAVISVYGLHSLALRSNGTVVAWGLNTGCGETNVPGGLSNVVAIAAGYEHNLAVKADGTVVAWGCTNYGQCSVPAGLSNVMDVAAG